MEENKNFQTRKSIRLKEYDYSQEGMYFITICTQDRKCVLSEILGGSVKTDPYIKLNNIGIMVEKELKKIEEHFKTIKIHDYVIMPNHIHFIIEKIIVGAGLDLPDKKIKITNVIGLFKADVSRRIGYSFWQRNYYEHIIRSEKELYKIKEYIQYNPLNWEKDKYNC